MEINLILRVLVLAYLLIYFLIMINKLIDLKIRQILLFLTLKNNTLTGQIQKVINVYWFQI